MRKPRLTGNDIRKLALSDGMPDMLGDDFLEHVAKRHLLRPESDCVQSVFLQSTESGFDGVFTDREAMRGLICATAYAHADEIAAYADQARSSSGRLPAKMRFESLYDTPLPNAHTAIKRQSAFSRNPITGSVFEAHADKSVLVLAPDPDSELGIAGVTAYAAPIPSAVIGTGGTKTGRDILPLLRQTALYQSATPLHRACLEELCNPSHLLPTSFDARTNTMTVQLPKTRDDGVVRALHVYDRPETGFACALSATSFGRDSDGRATRSFDQVTFNPFDEKWDRIESAFPNVMSMISSIIDRQDEIRSQNRMEAAPSAKTPTIDELLGETQSDGPACDVGLSPYM